MKALIWVAIFAAGLALGARWDAAWYQCAGFAHTRACLVNDILTGEDL